LADAIPQDLRVRWSAERDTWLQFHRQPWTSKVEQEYHERFSAAIEHWLDAGYGACVLNRIDCAGILDETLRFFDGKRLDLLSFVIMPNHVHVLFVQHPGFPLERLLRSWKTFTARSINKLLGRSGPLWQRDYFDRLIRDSHHFANCVRYIRRNPKRAKLRSDQYILYESEIARSID
jgi:REP element-mobilizing transposase RayT